MPLPVPTSRAAKQARCWWIPFMPNLVKERSKGTLQKYCTLALPVLETPEDKYTNSPASRGIGSLACFHILVPVRTHTLVCPFTHPSQAYDNNGQQGVAHCLQMWVSTLMFRRLGHSATDPLLDCTSSHHSSLELVLPPQLLLPVMLPPYYSVPGATCLPRVICRVRVAR